MASPTERASPHKLLRTLALFLFLTFRIVASRIARVCVAVEVQTIGGVAGLIPIGVAEVVERALEARTVGLWHLNASEHPSVVGPMVAVMEQRDVPGVPEAVEEL